MKQIIISGVVTLIVTVLSFIITNLIKENVKLKKEKNNNEKITFDALENGLKCLLRAQLMEYHKKHMLNGTMSSNEYENWVHMYSAYKDLGGNGMISHMNDDINTLPIECPNKK